MSLLPHCVSTTSLCLCYLTVSLQIRWPCSTLWRVQQGLESSLPTPTSGSWNSLHSARHSFGALHFRSRSGELTGLGCCGILAGNCSGARYAVRSSTRERVSVRECECMRERDDLLRQITMFDASQFLTALWVTVCCRRGSQSGSGRHRWLTRCDSSCCTNAPCCSVDKRSDRW